MFSRKTNVPSVLILIILGVGLQELMAYFSMEPDYFWALEVLGILGLIMIVLEAALDLELKKEKWPIIWKSFTIASLSLGLTSISIAFIIQFFIPDAFSPNGDNINDYFEIPGIEYYEGNSIEIFNRWGNKVYEARNYGINTVPKYWNGKSNTGFRLGSEDLPTGTYFYVLNLGKGEGRIAGSVYLDR